MKMWMRMWMKLLIMIASVSVQQAQAGKSAARKAAPQVVYEKKTNIDLNDKDVDGQFLKPNGQAIRGDQNLSFDDLMSPTKDFSNQLQRSSGAL